MSIRSGKLFFITGLKLFAIALLILIGLSVIVTTFIAGISLLDLAARALPLVMIVLPIALFDQLLPSLSLTVTRRRFLKNYLLVSGVMTIALLLIWQLISSTTFELKKMLEMFVWNICQVWLFSGLWAWYRRRGRGIWLVFAIPFGIGLTAYFITYSLTKEIVHPNIWLISLIFGLVGLYCLIYNTLRYEVPSNLRN